MSTSYEVIEYFVLFLITAMELAHHLNIDIWSESFKSNTGNVSDFRRVCLNFTSLSDKIAHPKLLNIILAYLWAR